MKRVLSGMRPTGRLHLGHLLGALSNWKKLQEEYACLYMVADWHALTSEYKDTSRLRENIFEVVIDWLSAGIDPQRCTIFRQSDILEQAELHLLLSCITPLGWLERNPTHKEQLRELGEEKLSTYGFLGYPVLQAADILIYKGQVVPIGEDQLPHLELTREITRRFNHLYGKIFPEPRAILTKVPRLPGLDGRKMSKSYGNCIYLSDSQQEVAKKVMNMFTDPDKIRKDDPGHPEGHPGEEEKGKCVVFAFHKAFNQPCLEAIREECEKGSRGCVLCKKELIDILEQVLSPIREKRATLEAHPEEVAKLLAKGKEEAGKIAKKTMEEVRRAMKLC